MLNSKLINYLLKIVSFVNALILFVDKIID